MHAERHRSRRTPLSGQERSTGTEALGVGQGARDAGTTGVREEAARLAGYARRVLTPLSVTGVVLFTACLLLVVLGGLGIFALLRGRGGD